MLFNTFTSPEYLAITEETQNLSSLNMKNRDSEEETSDVDDDFPYIELEPDFDEFDTDFDEYDDYISEDDEF
ncbi:hypothetical protein [Bernardetia sp.]|uniref:hypothetical protein n=1 Tax=Bernardetia sp. TaxID=1937974 RepID=UPI0025BE5BFF|nr:hypothetical protein [Bernardetia sp.]